MALAGEFRDEDGKIQRLDAAIFADTGWEPQSVYDHLDWLESVVDGRIPIVRVSNGQNLRDDSVAFRMAHGTNGDGLSIPVFFKHDDGTKGMFQQRRCTEQYKLRTIAKYIRFCCECDEPD